MELVVVCPLAFSAVTHLGHAKFRSSIFGSPACLLIACCVVLLEAWQQCYLHIGVKTVTVDVSISLLNPGHSVFAHNVSPSCLVMAPPSLQAIVVQVAARSSLTILTEILRCNNINNLCIGFRNLEDYSLYWHKAFTSLSEFIYLVFFLEKKDRSCFCFKSLQLDFS